MAGHPSSDPSLRPPATPWDSPARTVNRSRKLHRFESCTCHQRSEGVFDHRYRLVGTSEAPSPQPVRSSLSGGVESGCHGGQVVGVQVPAATDNASALSAEMGAPAATPTLSRGRQPLPARAGLPGRARTATAPRVPTAPTRRCSESPGRVLRRSDTPAPRPSPIEWTCAAPTRFSARFQRLAIRTIPLRCGVRVLNRDIHGRMPTMTCTAVAVQ